jgi:hypothetical protein
MEISDLREIEVQDGRKQILKIHDSFLSAI